MTTDKRSRRIPRCHPCGSQATATQIQENIRKDPSSFRSPELGIFTKTCLLIGIPGQYICNKTNMTTSSLGALDPGDPRLKLDNGSESLVMPIIRRHETLSITHRNLLQRWGHLEEEVEQGQRQLLTYEEYDFRSTSRTRQTQRRERGD